MISNFIAASLKKAKYKKIGDGTYWGDIKGLRGVWANAKTLNKCKEEMKEVLEEWLIIKIRHGDPIPGLTLGSFLNRKVSYA